MGKSYKKHVIEAIFNDRWDAKTGTLSKTQVSLVEVQQYIRKHNDSTGKDNSDKNPANFFKDFVRVTNSANANWPESVFKKGYSGRQVTGDRLSFEFVPILPGQTEPFPKSMVPLPPQNAPAHIIESLSLQIASRRLGRRDEPWLTQVLTKLRVIETHFATQSPNTLIHIDHLQMNVKLHGAEIDSIYLGVERLPDGRLGERIIICEAKGKRDDILITQIVKQAKAAFSIKSITQDTVIPVVVKVVGPSRVYIVEFGVVERANIDTLENVVIASSGVYEFKPPVEGIS